MLFSELLVLDDRVPRDGPLNMAIDEALLARASPPILRFYRWNAPWVSFGYFGSLAEAREFAGARPLVRRWTGGGIVPHGDDITYSLIVAGPSGRGGTREFYRSVHESVASALAHSAVQTTLAQSAAVKISARCFANPVFADLIEEGRKIAGAAQRKTRGGLLHQGSIQRRELPETFRETLASELSSNRQTFMLDRISLQNAENLASSKYATPAWIQRR